MGKRLAAHMGQLAAVALGVLLAVVTIPAAGATTATSTFTADNSQASSYNGLALTPPMGFNDWYHYQCHVTEQTIVHTADALVSSGLSKLGYDYVNLDDCWMADSRAADGQLQADPTTFPHGIPWLANYVHSLGLKFGIYESAGTIACSGRPGSYGHYRQDAQTFASWGIDYLKFDWCAVPFNNYPNMSQAQVDESLIREMSADLANTGRPIVLSQESTVGNNGPDMMSWVGQYSNLWRTTTDITDSWSSVLKNYEGNVGLWRYAHPGAWNDPDMILAGNGGMSTTEYQTQFTLWAEMAAPLLVSTDLTNMSADTYRILSNKAVIAVDQDPLGIQGHIVAQQGSVDILSKPLANGDRAVVLFNNGNVTTSASVTAQQTGIGQSPAYLLRNLWTGQASETAGVISATVPAHGTVIYRVSPSTPNSAPPAVNLSVSAPPLAFPGQPMSVSVTFTNNGRLPVQEASLGVEPPSSAWTVRATDATTFPVVDTNQTVRVTWKLTAPTSLPPGASLQLTANASYSWPNAPSSRTAQETTDLLVPGSTFPTLASAFNNVGITNDSDPTAGNFDGGGNTYSAQALAAQGLTPGAGIVSNGATFTWPAVPAGTPDNVAGGARTIALSGNGTSLAFLGAEDNYSTDTAVVTYTDGTEQQFPLSFPNWCCEAGPPFADGAQIVATMTYRNTPSGPHTYPGVDWWVFYQSVPLSPGKTVKAVTLPSDQHIHVFALSVH